MKVTEQTLEQEIARLMGEKFSVGVVTQTSLSSSDAKLKKQHGRKQLDILLNTRFSALVLTPFLRQNFGDILLDELCARIKQAKSELEPTDLNLVVNVLREAVKSLVLKLRRGKGIPKPALEGVMSQFELFSKLAGDGGKVETEAIESIARDLVGYIIVNQILLYFLLKHH